MEKVQGATGGFIQGKPQETTCSGRFFSTSCSTSCSLTQQDEDAGQNSNERSFAEAGRQAVGLGVARHDVSLLVAAAHPDGQSTGAGLHRLLAIGHEDGQVEDGLVLLGPAAAARQDPRRVVWRQQR